MPSTLRVLVVEDFESDAELILRQLEKAGYAVTFARVENKTEMANALARQGWDIVISDYRLPQFDAPAALAQLQKSGQDIPFIAVSGTIGEETAAALMKSGAHDYLMKDNLVRLAPVVERELAEARRRAEYRQAEQMVRESESRYRMLFENSPISLWEEDFSEIKKCLDALRAEGVSDFEAYFSTHPHEVREISAHVKILDVNQTSLILYKANSKAELIANLDKIIPPTEVDSFKNDLLTIAAGQTKCNYETLNFSLDNELIDISLNWTVVSGHEHDYSRVIISVQDISQLKRTEHQLRQTEARLRSLVEEMPACVYTEKADTPGKISYMSPQIEALTGYSPAEWENEINFWKKVVHPDDLGRLNMVNAGPNQASQPISVEYRILTIDGRIVWVRDEAVLIRDESGQALFWQGVIHDITETKTAEAELQESQRRIAQLMSNLPGMAYRTKAETPWSLEFASEGCLKLTGYQPEELTAGDGQRFTRMVHPDDLEMEHALILAGLANKRPFQTSYRIILPSGEEKWVWEQGQGIHNEQGGLVAVEGFITDISELKQAEAAIRRHLSELEVLYQNSSAINRLMDPRQIAEKLISILEEKMDWHHIAVRLYNTQTGEVEMLALNQPGLSVDELTEQEHEISKTIKTSASGLSGWVYENGISVLCPHVKDDPRYVETHPNIRSGLYVPLRTGERTIGSISVESFLENAFGEQDERLLTTIANQAAISIENAQLYLMAQVELAARKQAETLLLQAQTRLEQRVAERTADLKTANLALEKAARLKDEFLASMSHELRTPLTGILGLSEVLQLQTYGQLSEKQMAAMKHITTSGRHLLELINDILDLSRIEARQLVLRLGPCQLGQVCQTSLKAVSEQVQQKRLSVSFRIDPEGITIQADGQRLKQMLGNLLSNAIKFTPAGGSIGIEVHGNAAEKLVRITVWDTGIGIRSEDVPRLFQTFVQLDASLARQYNGTGLGLVLVKRLAELQGGSVTVESVFGAGSRFTISLPWDV